ncbi:Transcription factor [Lithohypha guttulata]|uniref:Transcription factor n=1 Tax=Lithohypha guttulata TaxID=1690604 RepID=A0AAN7T3K0_9EURO|nr:Transcription factor [Lithohypha guttulata]
MHDHQDEVNRQSSVTIKTQSMLADMQGAGSNEDRSPVSVQIDRRTASEAHPKKKRKLVSIVDARKSKGGDTDPTSADDPVSPKHDYDGEPEMDSSGEAALEGSSMDLRPSTAEDMSISNAGPTNQPMPVAEAVRHGSNFNLDDQYQPQQQHRLNDLSSFHPNYMFNANEINDEYNLFNDFLSTSLFDETGMFSTEDMSAFNDPSFRNSMNVSLTGTNGDLVASGHGQPNLAIQGPLISRPASTKPVSDKAREKYYMTAADPAGTDPPEERMNKLLKAKYDAGLLKPFNYVSGYARLNKYMEKNMKPASRHKILMQLDRFRPKFRERMQSLTDIELVLVEMWFERSLMEYDRVFASMAIPACCWRRTGEIFRANREMAELINVPIESLRDGKLAIHDFIVEDQLVSYWEKFCAICFDQQQKAMLTSCTLRSLKAGADYNDIQCCFSFTIKRDNHNIPSLIVGNFLPVNPPKS